MSLRDRESDKKGDQLRPDLAVEPIGLQPSVLGQEGLAAGIEWSQPWTIHGRQIGQPTSLLVRLDVAMARVMAGLPSAERSISSE